jgi:hypothetical protein
MKIPESLTRAVGRQLLVARQHAPQALFVAGIVGAVSSTVLACKATLKLGDKLDYMKGEIESTKLEYYNPSILAHREYTETQQRKDLAYIYARGSFDIAKLYAPALIVGTASIACLTGSHVTLTRRNAALTAAYTSLFEAYKSYRERVREQVGEEKEREIYLGAPVAIDKKSGDKIIKTTAGHNLSQYSRWFDRSNPNWQKTAEYNRAYIDLQIFQLNDRLKARGHVFLNEVYDDLGLSHTSQGAIVGWTWPPREGCDGDIICDIMVSRQDFHIGNEYQILLDFNVDGIIWNLIS